MMYKITSSRKVKQLWFKLIYKDLYYYKSKDESPHKGMHNLSGVYIKELGKLEIDNLTLYGFSVLYPKKARNYYLDSMKDFRIWIDFIRRATGYQNLTDIYEVKVIIYILIIGKNWKWKIWSGTLWYS